ncbi:hypothetical protein [Nocardia sp. NPDC058480]|uniref:hypothetical protein n=1 Tax=unclassified Nocardia TaxID=2637762 RepID=UPI003651552F
MSVIKKFTAAAALAALTVSAVGGQALADPAPAPEPNGLEQIELPLAPGINYTASIVDKSVVIATDVGSFTERDGKVQIRNGVGTVVAELPLTYQLAGRAYPIAAEFNGTTATLTPDRNTAAAVTVADAPTTGPLVSIADARRQADASYPTVEARNAAAFGSLVQQATIASVSGAMIGTVIGGVAGCVLGAAVLTAATLPLAALLGAGPIAGCAAGALMLGPVGTMAGTIFVGAPILAYSAFQYFQTVHAPFVASVPH